jgi:hypothetical protein
LDNILTGHSYINFHTTQFGTGEIRGAIVQRSRPAVFQAAGLTASSIQCTVDAFRAELGEPNNANNPSTLLATPPTPPRVAARSTGTAAVTTLQPIPRLHRSTSS